MTEYTAKKVILKDANNNYLIPYTEDELPSQANNSGKFLTTDGTHPSWATVSAGHNLFDVKWSDHILNDENWLRSELFSWHSGVTYNNAYNHLVNDIGGKTPVTEVFNDLTITYYIADDGHRICLADQEEAIAELYSAFGIAWYYILDTTNSRFKLPRTKYSFKGIRDSVGVNIDESLPNITGNIGRVGNTQGHSVPSNTNGAFSTFSSGGGAYGGGGGRGNNEETCVSFNASRSSSVYQDNASVQERATQMYLYFYVGGFSQTATQQTAGLNSELINQKVDRSDLAPIYPVIETYKNGSSWYRIYAKDDYGYWCEQGGRGALNENLTTTITLLKAYADTNYSVSAVSITASTAQDSEAGLQCTPISTTQITLTAHYINPNSQTVSWQTSGYIEV